MGNFYHHYYNGKNFLPKPAGYSTNQLIKEKAIDGHAHTNKQMQLHKDLMEYCLTKKIMGAGLFKRPPRNGTEASQQIKAMYSIIRKHGMMDDWKARKQQDAEV